MFLAGCGEVFNAEINASDVDCEKFRNTIHLYFSYGFKGNHIKVYQNEELVYENTCTTNESIGYCLTGKKIDRVLINSDDLTSLKVVCDNDEIIIPVIDSINCYRKITLSHYDDEKKWSASYSNNYSNLE